MTTKLIREGMTYGVMLGLTLVLLGCGGGGNATKEPPEPTVEQQVRKAQSMLRAGRVTEAMDIMHTELAKDPDNARLQSEYGKFCFQAARYDEAERAFDRALSLDPFMTDVRNFLGAVYAQTGRPAEAEAAYRAALNDPAYPTPEMIYLNLGLLYAGQGRDEEAIDALRRALELNPKYYKAHYELASLLDRTGQLREAAREYEVAGPDYVQAAEYHYRLGWVYFRLDNKDKARDSLQRAITLGPGSYSAAKADELLQMMD